MPTTSLQTIINRSEKIGINHRSIVATTITRNQKILTAERSSYKPWQFTITPTNGYYWDKDNRSLIADLEKRDQWDEHVINLGEDASLNWLTEYNGDLSDAQLEDMTIASVGDKTLVLTLGGTVTALSSPTVLFAAGDIIQPANSRYPYKVTSDLTRGSGATRTVHVHRGVIAEDVSIVGQELLTGNDCTWTVVLAVLPTYAIAPGRFVEWSGNFEAVEKII